MTPCVATALEVVSALDRVGAEYRKVCDGDANSPIVIRVDLGSRFGYVAIHDDGRAAFLPRNPDGQLVPWDEKWAQWLAGKD